MPPISSTLFLDIISRLVLIINPPPPPPETQHISNPNNTTTTSLPSSPNNLISPIQSDRPILSFNLSHDLESDNPNNMNIELPEWKRIGKVVQTVGFGSFGVLITLLVNNPTSATAHPAFYIAYLTFVRLGLASTICLSVFSIIKKGSPTVGLLQKRLMYFTLFFVVLACFFRLQIALSLVDLGFVTMLVLIGLLVTVLYLLLSNRCQRQITKTGT